MREQSGILLFLLCSDISPNINEQEIRNSRSTRAYALGLMRVYMFVLRVFTEGYLEPGKGALLLWNELNKVSENEIWVTLKISFLRKKSEYQ